MSLGYYPGCSLTATGVSYDRSARAVCEALGVGLTELEDWNCCGATAYFSVREAMSFAVSARNLALAAQQGHDTVVAPCSACFLGLRKTNLYMKKYPELGQRVSKALDAADMHYDGEVKVRHLVDVIMNDVGFDAIQEAVVKPLTGLKVAGYAGCQMVRPFTNFGELDDTEYPTVLSKIAEALGADSVDFPLSARCCGGSQMMTNEEVALGMCRELLTGMANSGADVVITTCPLCHMNLDMFQKTVNGRFGTSFSIPVLYFTQIMGIAMGLGDMGIDKNITAVGPKLTAFV